MRISHSLGASAVLIAVAALVIFIAVDRADVGLHEASVGGALWAAWIQAIGSIAAIAASVWVVQRQHALERAKDLERQIDERVDLINGALLVLKSQLDMVDALRRQQLEDFRDTPARHLIVPATQEFQLQELRLDRKQFAFLLRTSALDLLQKILLAHDTFHTAMQIVNDRSQFHRNVYQPQLESADEDLVRGVHYQRIEERVGVRVTYTLKRMTNDLYSEVDSAIQRLSEVGVSANAELRKVFPGRRFIIFKIPQGKYEDGA